MHWVWNYVGSTEVFSLFLSSPKSLESLHIISTSIPTYTKSLLGLLRRNMMYGEDIWNLDKEM